MPRNAHATRLALGFGIGLCAIAGGSPAAAQSSILKKSPQDPSAWSSPVTVTHPPMYSTPEACPDAKTRFKHWMQRTHWGYPEYFGREPFGSATMVTLAAMKQGAVEERSILYRCDFYPEDSANSHLLTSFGVAHLARILQRSAGGPLFIGIERSPANPALDEVRRKHVAGHPFLHDLVRSPDQIRLITKPWGLDGAEAVQHHGLQLNSASQGGLSESASGAGSSFGGMSR